MRPALLAVVMLGLALGAGPGAMAQSATGNWSSLAADRSATQVGDSLTIMILETNSASSSAQNSSRRDTRLSGAFSSGAGVDESAGLGLEGGFDGRGQAARSGRLLGQISVVVQEVLPNGDLRVAGQQTLQIDGERTAIRVTGRVRRADISPDNTVVSSRLADAQIAYEGHGALSRSAGPGLLNRILSWLGLS